MFILSQLLLLVAASGEADDGSPADAVQCDPAGESASCGAVDGDVLLQKGNARARIAVDESSGETSPEGTVSWDGYDTFSLEREEFHGGFPAEIYYRVSRNQFGDMNASHVFIPFNTMIKAIFIRHMHDIGSYEYGMATWNWQSNPLSAVSDNVSVGTGEKLHTFVHEGAWSNESLAQAQRVQEERWDTTEMLAGASRVARHAAVNTYMLFAGLGGQLIKASTDPDVFRDIEAAALAPSSAFDQRMEAMAANLTQKHEDYVSGLGGALPTPSSTALDCYHFTAVPGIQLTPQGVWMPLGRKIPSMQGQINLAPLERFNMMHGNSFIRYDADAQAFGIYMGVAMHSNVVDPYISSGALRHQPKLFVGPADGAARSIPPEGRPRPARIAGRKAAAIWSMHESFSRIPADYKFLWGPWQEECPPAELQLAKDEIQNLDLAKLVRGEATTAEKLHAITVLTTGVGCSTEYMRADIPNSHSYGPMGAASYLHAVMEFGFAVMERGWNTISEELFCPASGCATTTPTTTTTTTEDPWWHFWP